MDSTQEPRPAETPASGPPGFRLLRLLAESAFSSVYLAEETRLGRQVVVKFLSRLQGAEPGFRERFQRELEAVARLEHPNIVPVYASGEVDGRPYAVLRYVPRGDLGHLLTRERNGLGLRRTARIVTQVASALDAAHEAGLVHRDIKPGNVLVDHADHAYLADFGIVKRLSDQSVTTAGVFVGTPGYAAPEQIQAGRIDRRTDVYALGCVTYQCLTGSRPFEGSAVQSVLSQHLNEPPPKVTDRRPDLDRRVDAIVATAMAKDPGDRYATAGAFAEALANLGPGRAGTAPRRRAWRRTAIAAGATALLLIAAVAVVQGVRGGASPAASDSTPTPTPTPTSSPTPAKSRTHTLVMDLRPGPGRSGSAILVATPPFDEGQRKVCSEHDPHGSRLCVSTGPRIPTTVWFENRAGFHIPAVLGVAGDEHVAPVWGETTTIKNGTVQGLRWNGFPNDCYRGLIYFPDGSWGAQTHTTVCVV